MHSGKACPNSPKHPKVFEEGGTSLVAQPVKNLPAMQDSWVQSLNREDPLEKGLETHSSILAQRIPWTEESGRRYMKAGAAFRGHLWAVAICHLVQRNFNNFTS